MLPSNDGEILRILWLSLCFMLLFAADTTMSNMQKTVISSISNDYPGFNVEGYTMTALIYTMFAIAVWFGPFVNHSLGPKLTMVLSSIGYLWYIISFAIEREWAIYSAAVVVGIAAGTLWPSQGCYLIENSSPKTTARNVGVFWFIYTSSNMLGNIFIYFTFYGKKEIDQHTRRTAVYILVIFNIIAVLAFLLLPKSNSKPNDTEHFGPIKALKKSWNIFMSSKMRWLTITFCYAGLQQSFWIGIYSPSVGFTLAFGDSSKELVPLSGIFISVGALLGSLGPIVFAEWISNHKIARKLIVLGGIVAQLCTYLIAFINLPDSAVFGDTVEESFIPPSAVLAMLGSLLLGFGDSCLNTQIYSSIGEFYRDSSAETCALYKFVKGAVVALSFYVCNHLGLHTQAIILSVTAVVGCMAFFKADQDSTKKEISTETT